MASLRRFSDSKFWYACFTGPDGRRLQHSTKETDRKRAQKIADQYEGVADTGRMGLLTERQARKVIGEIFQISNRHALVSETMVTISPAGSHQKRTALGTRVSSAIPI